MSKRDSDARRYRARAAELRAIAKDIKSQNERELLLEVANEYELMALSADVSDARNGNGPAS
jgi:hypothetical protein